MSVIPCFGAYRGCEFSATFAENRLGFGAVARLNRTLKVSRPFEYGTFHISPFSLSHSRSAPKRPNVRMTLVDEKPEHGRDVVKPSDILVLKLPFTH
ncbi:hypothetical protein Acr_10g0006420 [Actinidia rufa]|uniref:Uncharacterized protein n=1 Tax=Actinidia rufa TaxID=165716 RepID=A0A7J0FBJ5_9ERIC|nr:hypothetical protein Acr_10g0006420 [Actinidia rufa]